MIIFKLIRRIYADEPRPNREESLSFMNMEEITEEDDPSTIIMNQINACKYEVYSWFNIFLQNGIFLRNLKW